MDCSDVRRSLRDLLRHRLEPPLADEARAHLEGCAACGRARDAEETLDGLLAERLPRHAAPAALKRRLARLADPAPAWGPPERGRWTRFVAPALAAGLAVASGALLLERHAGRESAALERLTDEAVNDHLRVLASQHPLEIESGGSHQVKPWFEGRLDFAPVVPLPEWSELQLRGGAVGYFLDRRAAVMAYSLRRHAVTLLAFRSEGLRWPAGGSPAAAAQVQASSARGIHVALWRAGALGYALVSDVAPDELARLAAAFAAATAP